MPPATPRHKGSACRNTRSLSDSVPEEEYLRGNAGKALRPLSFLLTVSKSQGMAFIKFNVPELTKVKTSPGKGGGGWVAGSGKGKEKRHKTSQNFKFFGFCKRCQTEDMENNQR